MRLVGRARLDPPRKQRTLVVRQGPLATVGRWHGQVGVGVMDPREHRAPLGCARNDRCSAGAGLRRCFERIEAQACLLLGAIRSVTLEASITQDRADVAPVPDLTRHGRRSGPGPGRHAPPAADRRQPRAAHAEHQGTQEHAREDGHAPHPSPETHRAKANVPTDDLHRGHMNRMVSPWMFSARQTVLEDRRCRPGR